MPIITEIPDEVVKHILFIVDICIDINKLKYHDNNIPIINTEGQNSRILNNDLLAQENEKLSLVGGMVASQTTNKT